jgi:hypothetical protein
VKHIVQFSTGAGSAEVAWRVVEQYGADNTLLLTADTLAEDDDNWRFAREVVAALGCEWVIVTDGRTPMQVGRDAHVVPNNRMAVCSRVLKRDILRDHLTSNFDPTDSIIYLGFDWTEDHRMKAATPHWTPWTIDAPMMRPPYLMKQDVLDLFRTRGIEPPRLYAQGFAHANCGGACVRGGQAQWQLLLTVNRDRYVAWENEEEQTRQMLGKNVAILRDRRGGTTTPLTLRSFRQRLESIPTRFDGDDWGACGCFMPDDPEAI